MHEVVKNLKELAKDYRKLSTTFDDSWDFERKYKYYEKEYDLILKMEEETKKLDNIKLGIRDAIELTKLITKFSVRYK